MEYMQGKVCLVTGSTSGIGRVTALELAKMGATVVLACRDKSKGEATRDEIKAQNSDALVDMLAGRPLFTAICTTARAGL